MSYAQSIDDLDIKLTTGKVAQALDDLDMSLTTSTGDVAEGITLASPANGETGVAVDVSFSWTSGTDYGAYRLIVDDDSQFGSPVDAYVTTESGSLPSDLASATEYSWKVQGGNLIDNPVIPTGEEKNDSRAGDEASLELIYGATKGDNVPTLSTVGDLPDPTQTLSPTDDSTPITQRSYIVGGDLYQLIYLQDPAERVWRNFGTPWNDSTGWATSGMSLDDNIYGVTTETIGGELRVVEIDVRTNALIGTLPEFPGLQQMRAFHVKQHDSAINALYANNARQSRYLYYERLTGALPDSLGQTSVTDLSLAGRPKFLDAEGTYLLSEEGSYNTKNGRSINAFTGGIPDSWANLSLEYLELQGQGTGFNGELKQEVVSNWNIKRIAISGTTFNDSEYDDRINYIPVGNGFTGQIPSGVNNWVDCDQFSVGSQLWSGIAVDAFDGWNDIEGRTINLGYDAPDFSVNDQNYFNQDLPDLSGLTKSVKFGFDNRGWTGSFPSYINNGLFTNLQEIRFANHRFTGTGPIVTEESKTMPGRWLGINIPTRFTPNLTGGVFESGMTLNGVYENRVILFYIQSNSNINGGLPEGAHEWYRVRYAFLNDAGLTGELPSRVPAEYSPSLRQLNLNNNNFTGSIPEGYGNVGSRYDYGGSLLSVDGSITNSGSVTASGSDGTGFYVEDSNQSWAVNEFQPETSTANGPRVKDGASTSTTRVISNTATRIYFENDLSLTNGDSFDIVRNQETDERDFSGGLNLSANDLTGDIPESLALDAATSGASLNITNNKFQMDHILSSYSTIKALADSNGWTYRYAPQQKFGVSQEINGVPYTIDYSANFAEGNSYTWYKNGVVISGETGSSLTISDNTGRNEFYVEVTNSTLTDFSGGNVLESETTIIDTTETDI